jgi:hypothetical protein
LPPSQLNLLAEAIKLLVVAVSLQEPLVHPAAEAAYRLLAAEPARFQA